MHFQVLFQIYFYYYTCSTSSKYEQPQRTRSLKEIEEEVIGDLKKLSDEDIKNLMEFRGMSYKPNSNIESLRERLKMSISCDLLSQQLRMEEEKDW